MVRQSSGSLSIRSVASFAVVGLIAAGALAGCGHHPPQSKEHSSIAGIDASVGNIAIRNAQITLGANGNAAVTLALFNEGTEPDALVSVSSTSAQGSTLPRTIQLDLTPKVGVFITALSDPIVLTQVKSALVGANIPVQLTFKTAGSVTVLVPVVGSDQALRVGPQPTATSTATAPTSALPVTTVSPTTTPTASSSR